MSTRTALWGVGTSGVRAETASAPRNAGIVSFLGSESSGLAPSRPHALPAPGPGRGARSGPQCRRDCPRRSTRRRVYTTAAITHLHFRVKFERCCSQCAHRDRASDRATELGTSIGQPPGQSSRCFHLRTTSRDRQGRIYSLVYEQNTKADCQC